jgi:hypothetical protein
MPDFQLTTSLNILLILLAVPAAALLTFVAYRYTVPPVSGLLRFTLMLLRALGLFLLFLVLGEPLLSLVFHRTDKPVLAVMIDQSKSMTIRDKQGDRKEIVLGLMESQALRDVLPHADLMYGVFDVKTRMLESIARDSVAFKGEGTDIGGALRQLKASARERNLQGVLLMTDGNSTTGSSVLAEAEELGIPVSAVGIGDTTIPQDILLQRVVANTITYVGTKVPVNVTLKSSGFSNERVEVTLLDGGAVRDRKTITLEPGIREYEVPLSFNPDADGTKKITVEVSQLPGELSTQNNRSSLYVKVLKSKMRVALFAGAPNADVAAVRRALQEDENIEVKPFIERGNGQFYEGIPTQQDFQDVECLVLVGYPGAASSASVLRMLADQCAGGKGLFFILSRTTDFGKLAQLSAALPFVVPQRQEEETQTFFTIAEGQRNNPILRSLPSPEVWAKLAPAFVPGEPMQAKPESEVLASGRIQSITTNDPLFISRRVNRSKSLALTCYGLWRWKTYAEGVPGSERLLENLISNSVRWLVTREDEKPVQVRPSKEMFAGSEPVEFTAQVYDENYQPVNEAEVSLSVAQQGQTSQLTLTSLGNGRFEGAFDPLPEGDYTYTARAIAGGKELAQEKGSFSVGGLNAEFLETRMNKLLLQQLAARTGGKYYDPHELGRLPADLTRIPEFKPRDVSLAQHVELWNKRWMMGVLVALFSIEWFLRKRNGML